MMKLALCEVRKKRSGLDQQILVQEDRIFNLFHCAAAVKNNFEVKVELMNPPLGLEIVFKHVVRSREGTVGIKIYAYVECSPNKRQYKVMGHNNLNQ